MALMPLWSGGGGCGGHQYLIQKRWKSYKGDNATNSFRKPLKPPGLVSCHHCLLIHRDKITATPWPKSTGGAVGPLKDLLTISQKPAYHGSWAQQLQAPSPRIGDELGCGWHRTEFLGSPVESLITPERHFWSDQRFSSCQRRAEPSISVVYAKSPRILVGDLS